MKYIGFTKKFYTLWEVEEQGRYMFYTYKKNLSFDLDRALAKEPTAIVDLSLRGHSSFKVEVIPSDCFQFGKHRGERFAECDDITYIAWYHNACKNEEWQKRIRPILVKGGYSLYNGKMLTETEIAKEKALREYFPKFEAKVNAFEPFRFKCQQNVSLSQDEFGCKCGKLNIPFCSLIFPTIAQKEYNGHLYYLPTDNGLEKRIKGFIVTIDEYEFETIGEMKFEIIVKKFHTEYIGV